MEKKIWTRPMAEVEQFMANEYIASGCGESGITYKFKCTAGDGAVGRVVGADGKSAHYQACDIEHIAESTDDFISGTFEECTDYDNRKGCRGGHEDPIQVVIWRGEHGDNTHCTTLLDQKFWETAKS